jgi:very-short-patch-repair endonuclease
MKRETSASPDTASPDQQTAGEAQRTLSSREKAAQKRIGELRRRLLDLSNRNRLLNYKFSNRGRRQLRIVDELPDELLRKLLDGKRLVFKALPEPGDQPADEKSDEFLLALEQAKRSDEEYLAALKNLNQDDDEPVWRIERALRDRLRKTLGMPDRRLSDQTSRANWARHEGIDPSFDLPMPKAAPKPSHLNDDIQTLLFPEEMDRVLSGVHDQARVTLQEKGVNTLYLALGYLEWYEALDSQTPMYAPLLLHPVDIERKIQRGRYRYSIGSLGDETEVNITLSERLHQDFHLRLPQLDEDDTPERYFRKVTETIKGMPGWRVRRFAVLGHFAFARLVMFQDLRDSHWPGGVGIIGNPVIAELFAGPGTSAGMFFAEDYEVDHPAIAAKVPLLIADADSSQFSAIADVMDGKNLVIKGPPGTGKSQTITNIIAAALARGKTVLFVAEKMAALNVVKDRLEKAGLGYFCLELHSTKARKKDLLESLDRRLKIQNRLAADGDLTAATKELERTRGLLSDYVATINRPFGASGKTVHQILWSEQRTRIRRESLPKALDGIQLAGAKEMTRHDVTALKDKLKVLADAYAAATRTGSLDRHPWFGIGDATLDYFGRERLVADMQRLRDALGQVASVLATIEGKVPGARPRTIGDAITLSEALARLPRPAPGIDFELYATLHDSAARAALEALQAEQAAWLETGRKLAEWTSDPNGLARRHSELRELAQLAAELGLDAPRGALIEQAAALRAEADKVEQAILFARRLAKGFGVADDPLTVATAQKLLAGAKQAAAVPSDLLPLRHPGLFNEQASAILRDADERAQTLARKIGQLAERLTVTLNGQAEEWRRHAQVLRSARFPFTLLRRDVRAAKTCWREMRRKPLKSKRHHMAADFEALAECVEIAASLTSDAGLQEVCGLHFRGHETEFNNLVQVNSYALAVKRTFGGDDAINERVRNMLLEGSIDALIQLASLACDPQSARTEVTIANISNTEVDLVAHHRTLNTRAQQIAELGRRALAIGLKSDLPAGAIPDLASVVNARLQAEAKIEANSAARALLGTRWHGAESDRSLIVNVLDAASEVDGAMLPEPIRAYLYDADRDSRISDLRAIRARLNDAINAAREAWSRVKDGGKVDEGSFFGAALEKTSVADALRRVDRALEVPDQLVVWIGYLVAREECVARGLAGIVDALARQALEAAQLSDALDLVFWRTLARAVLAEFPALSQFRGPQLEKARERFRHLDEEIIALQRKALAAELCRRRPDPGYRGVRRKDDTGLVLVNHEISKRKRHIPIRELLDRAGRSIQQMTPCFMMSPLSVAQFLKPDGLRFDLVLIDEASQMRPEEALGAIARGGQLVVVGDPMQLPPTSFFDRADRMEDEDLDEQEIEDRESILDLALAEFQPARNLRWHYRSRHESLIAFSNRHFYHDNLIVFPSPLDPDRQKRQPRLGVYHHFVGGKYKGRINVEEAQKVAEAAIKFMANERDRSLGIVTLNEPQSEVVREEIDRLVACNSAAQRYIERWEDTLEPFFVKNLENVQGDERDVIFISTVYGPDETAGVVANRFGPINGVHGHRRLNVLFTRAKYRVEVFTSMKPGDIRPDQGSNHGIHVLKAYLEYAESGRLEGGIISGREPDSEFEELVRDRLRERGYEVVSQVGVAGYFLDLAVKHPKRSGFILGIECDGASYHSSRSARDRDRLRQLVLESRGWNIYRIWSTDWFQNSQEELRRLLSHLDRLAREEPSVRSSGGKSCGPLNISGR